MNLKTIMIQGSLGILLTAGLSAFSNSNVLASPFIWPGSVDITDAIRIPCDQEEITVTIPEGEYVPYDVKPYDNELVSAECETIPGACYVSESEPGTVSLEVTIGDGYNVWKQSLTESDSGELYTQKNLEIRPDLISDYVSKVSDTAKNELLNMTELYAYAWYTSSPDQTVYDNVFEKTESGVVRVEESLPSEMIGYQIQDYDGDNQMELLTVRSDVLEGSCRLILQMYEVKGQTVNWASNVIVNMPAFATGIGKIRVYSRNLDGKILIGCDQYEEGFLWDGTTLKTSYYWYDGETFVYDSSTDIIGSSVDDNYVKQQLSVIGLDENQVKEMTGGKTAYDCLPGTELIVETIVDSDFNLYIPWSDSAAVGDRQTVGTVKIVNYGWYPDQEMMDVQNMETTQNAETTQNTETAPANLQTTNITEQLAEQADYLYIISEFERMQIDQTYYLIPDENHTQYDCYQTDGTYISTITYGNAKSIVDTAMTGNSELPTGQRVMLVWNSPYGLCAYSRTYKDYNPWYGTDENGNSVEYAPDIAQLPYMLDENEIRSELESLNLPAEIVVPTSQKIE